MNEPTPEQMIKLFSALARAQGEVKPAIKDRGGQIGTQTYKYADLAAVAEAVDGATSKNGLAIMFIPGMFNVPNIELRILITHEEGGWLEYPMSFPVDLTYPKNGSPFYSAQNVGKVLTYARRYAKVGILDIVTEDEDGQQNRGADRSHHSEPFESPRSSSEPTGASRGHMAQAAMELGAIPVGHVTAAALDGLRLTTNYPSNGIIGAYLNNGNTPETYRPEAVAQWAEANPGADGMVLLRAAAEYAVENFGDGPLKLKTKQWLEENK